MQRNDRIHLLRLSLIRRPYRSLLKAGRSHAAFDEEYVSHLVDELSGKHPILDSMAGYGSLMYLCSKKGIPSISIEVNVPLYLWQLMRNPNFSQVFIRIVDMLLSEKNRWPKIRKRADVSSSWFLPDALNVLRELTQLSTSLCRETVNLPEIEPEVIAAAVIVPFCGRLSCYTESGNNPTWVKQGGVVVYKNWEKDFKNYLSVLRSYLSKIISESVPNIEHKNILGNCRKISFAHIRFGSLLTSPSYPNRMDYHKMFLPETVFCDSLEIPGIKSLSPTEYIGSTEVKGTSPKRSGLQTVDAFLDYVLSESDKNKRNDNIVYYYPYFANYFSGLYEAFKNIAAAVDSDFSGFVIVQNNHFRRKEVPVAQAVSEMWRNLGFDAAVIPTDEVFHTGTLNPRARGIKAKQSKFTIRVVK